MRTLVLLASAMLMGGTVEAQATSRTRTIERDGRRVEETAAELRDRVIERVMVADSAMLNRATLGLMLGGTPTKRDTLGVFVEGVAENGPAERAGIYEGHRIAFINNVDVRASAADAGDAYLSSVGHHRLMRAMRDVSVGSTVTLRVWTGSGYRDVTVTTARHADVFKNQRFGMFHPGEERRIEIRPAPRPRARTATPSAPKAPMRMYAPGATPRMISVPAIAPTRAGVRHYTI